MTEVIDFPKDETGQASLLITLHDSRITVISGSRGTVLLSGKVQAGWWDQFFAKLQEDLRD